MTDRLAQLLDAAADDLDVPRPDPAAVLARGHRLRRRRRSAAGAGVLGLAGVVAGAVLVVGPVGSGSTIAADGPGSYLEGGAFSVGSEVHFGDTGDHVVPLDGPVQSMVYTSAGVVVGLVGATFDESDAAASYALVTPTGDVQPLPFELGDRVLGTSPASPYLAFAAPVHRFLVTCDQCDSRPGSRSPRPSDAEGWGVTVVDVRTGEVAGSTWVPGAFTWGGWEAPPVTIDGDTVYIGLDEQVVAVDWRTGAKSTAALLPGGALPVVAGGHAVVRGRRAMSSTVYDLGTGQQLARVRGAEVATSLSPDGRYLKAWYEYKGTDEGGRVLNPDVDYEVHDLDTGITTSFADAGAPWDVGWTPDGHRLRVADDGVSVCAPAADTCAPAGPAPGGGRVRIAGSSSAS